MDDTTSETLTYKLDEISNNTIIVDLSLYVYTTVDIKLSGKAVIQYDSSIEELTDKIKGTNEWDFNITYSV